MSHYSQLLELTTLKNHLDSNDFRAEVDATEMLTLEANRPPWQSTNITLTAEQQYSFFARGNIVWHQKNPMLFGGPAFHLWARVYPHGKIVNLTSDTGTFTADTDGVLQLGIYMGMWKSDAGELCHSRHYERLSGKLTVAIASWKTKAIHGVGKMHSLPTPPLLSFEHARLSRQYQVPRGWSYLTETGNAEIFHHATNKEGNESIVLDACNDQGIIRYPIETPLSDDLLLNWQWKLIEHPSLGPEDRSACHDYVSVAAEFDNGRDLTWIWSQYLEEDHHFHCPVKDWSKRETHYVVRNDADPRCQWVAESRRVRADVLKSQGAPPAKVVAIWLIAVSTFSHGRLRAEFREISLAGRDFHKIL